MHNSRTVWSGSSRAVWRRTALVACGLGLLAVGAVGAVEVPIWQWTARLRDPDASVRRAAARKLGGRRIYSAVDEIRPLILNDPDPSVRQAAADAAMKLDDREAIDDIHQAIVSAPDDETTALMIASLVMLAGRTPQVEAWLGQWSQSDHVYVRIGAAISRVESYEAAGMDTLLSLAGQTEGEPQAFVQNQLVKYLVPVGEMLGTRPNVGVVGDPARVASLRAWWARNGSDRVLKDALEYRLYRDEMSHQLKRLEHARERVGHMLGLL